ncbi:hypothetical protein DAEQUDRAFT_477148 [Daedalea quercina L-15889]|uniref:Uncharacterized protein n=1 Tax=Daedalea quercina L-15889 TaxID=1314783 RepID=A0A165MVP7_9APHY|nr:hypothetical protein DAEQUDRAFT_477148 [Daedalea quercina L-15889]
MQLVLILQQTCVARASNAWPRQGCHQRQPSAHLTTSQRGPPGVLFASTYGILRRERSRRAARIARRVSLSVPRSLNVCPMRHEPSGARADQLHGEPQQLFLGLERSGLALPLWCARRGGAPGGSALRRRGRGRTWP